MTAVLMSGCSNLFEKHYIPEPEINEIRGTSALIYGDGISPVPIRYSEQKDFNSLIREQAEKGYVRIGQTHIGTQEKDWSSDVQEQAKKIKAQAITWTSYYYKSEKFSTFYSVPTQTRTYGTADIYSSTGNRLGSLEQNSTTHGSQIVSSTAGLTLNWYNVIFWAKRRPGGLGVLLRKPTGTERTLNKTNKGMIIDLVYTGGSAFNADLVGGDLLLEANGAPINELNYKEVILSTYGQKDVPFKIQRNNSIIIKKISVDN